MRSLAVLAFVCSGATPLPAHDSSTVGRSCALSQRSSPRAVVDVIDGQTLLLDDGNRIRLVGALTPNLMDTPAAAYSPPAAAWKPATDARDALAQLVNGGSITLAFAGRRKDRHGRLLAHAFLQRQAAAPLWLQGAMLAAGHARAFGLPENFACMDALLAAEAIARTSRRGLWSNPAYQIRSIGRTFELLRLRDTYQIVQGRVLNAQRVKSDRIYLNFGTDWHTDFSVAIPTSLSRAHPAWAASLLDLGNKRVRVRGWILRRNGPMIELEDPSQIEILDGSAARQSSVTPPAFTDGWRR